MAIKKQNSKKKTDTSYYTNNEVINEGGAFYKKNKQGKKMPIISTTILFTSNGNVIYKGFGEKEARVLTQDQFLEEMKPYSGNLSAVYFDTKNPNARKLGEKLEKMNILMYDKIDTSNPDRFLYLPNLPNHPAGYTGEPHAGNLKTNTTSNQQSSQSNVVSNQTTNFQTQALIHQSNMDSLAKEDIEFVKLPEKVFDFSDEQGISSRQDNLFSFNPLSFQTNNYKELYVPKTLPQKEQTNIILIMIGVVIGILLIMKSIKK